MQGRPDGSFGDGTDRAVRAARRYWGMLECGIADRALIEREGLDVPETVRLLQDLRSEGLPLPADALDVDSCADAIAQALSRRA